jgi:outer membrane protein OmpA-like peptidoglycan-associated protein
VAVVGGARLWARFEAAGVPAAQAVSALPRELLISEGGRTLLVPLLLGGAVAVFTYLSRRRAEEDAESGEDADSATDDPSSALRQAKAAVTGASRDLGKADAAIEDLTSALTSARRRGREGKPPLKNLKAEAGEARARVERAVGSLEAAIRLTKQARASAERARRAEVPVRHIANAQRRLDKALTDLTSTSENVADAERILPANASPLPRALNQALELVNAASVRPSPAGRLLRAATDLARAEETTRGEIPLLLLRRLPTLAPIDYLRRWLSSLKRALGPAGAGVVVVALGLIFGGIGLKLLEAEPLVLLITTGALLAVAAALLVDYRPGAAVAVALLLAAFITLTLLGVAWGVAAITALTLVAVLVLSRGGRPMGAAVAVLAIVPALGVAGLASAVKFPYSLWVVGITLLTIWLALGAMSRWPSAKGVAWILFAAVAFWSGALGFIRERGLHQPRLEVAVVKGSSQHHSFEGFFLGRTSDHVYLASTDGCDGRGCRRVLSIPDDEVACLTFGPREKVPPEDDPTPTVTTELSEFGAETDDDCEPEPKADDKVPKRPVRNLSLAFDVNISPSLPLIFTPPWTSPRPDRNLSLDFDVDFSPSLQLFSAPPRTNTRFRLASEVLFRFGDDSLTPGARQRLRQVASWMRRARPRVVYIYGHTDGKGTEHHNRGLSRRRAYTVLRKLVRANAITRPRAVPKGFGEKRPAVCNKRGDGSDDPASRAYNRRVEIYTERPPGAAGVHCRRRRAA